MRIRRVHHARAHSSGNGSDRALDTGVKLYDVATKDWTLDTVIDVRKGVNNGVYMSCFSEETGHYRGFMLRQDNADTLTAYVGNSVGVTVDLPQGTSLIAHRGRQIRQSVHDLAGR